MSLGQDFGADALAAFDGELYDATLSRTVNGAYSESDPTGAPASSTTVYNCQGIAFTYDQEFIDGTRIMQGDYRVVILRASLAVVPQPDDIVSVPPPGGTVAKAARVVAVEVVTEAQVTVHVRGVLA